MPRMRPGAAPDAPMAYADPQGAVQPPPATKAIQTLVKQPNGAYRPAPAPQAAPAAPTGGRVTVGKGDTLWAIAAKTLGDGNRWQEIARANGVRNPRSLQPGTVLTIPGAEADVPMPRMRPDRPPVNTGLNTKKPYQWEDSMANRYGASEPGRGRGLLDQIGTFGPASGPPIPADGRAPPDTRWMDPGMTMTDPSMNADAWQTPPPGLVFGPVPSEGQFNERFAGPADRPVPSMDQFAERFGGQPPPAPSMAEFDQRFAPPADAAPPIDVTQPGAVQAYIADTRASLEELRRQNSGQPPPSPEAYPSARAGARQPWTEAERARLDGLAQRYGQPVYAGPNGVVVFRVP